MNISIDSAFLNDDTEPATTLTTEGFHAGYVGLYDFSSQRFDNVVITAEHAWPDLNFDGIIDLVDFSLLANNWLDDSCDSEGIWCDSCDMDYNSVVDIEDLMVLTDKWLTIVAP